MLDLRRVVTADWLPEGDDATAPAAHRAWSAWPPVRGRRLGFTAITRADLAAVRGFVTRESDRAGAAPDARDGLALAADEVSTNVLLHAYAGVPGPLTVDVWAGPGPSDCAVTVADAGPPFDPTADPAAAQGPPPSTDPAEWAVGGLGWHLVRAHVAEVWYARAGAHNLVTLTGHAGPPERPAPPARPPADSLMDITIAHEQEVTVVSVAGSLDALTADTLADALADQLRGGRTRLVAGLAGVDYTSSAGLRALLATVREARRLGGDLRLAGAQARVQRVLQVSGFTSLFRSYADVPEAVASWAS